MANAGTLALLAGSAGAILGAFMTKQTGTTDPPEQQLQKLKAAYTQARTELASKGRTEKMTGLAMEMVTLAQALPSFDVAAVVASDKREDRLAGYAHAFGLPKPTYFGPIVDSLIKYDVRTQNDHDNRQFGEYWGLLALGKVTDAIQKAGASVLPSSASIDKFVQWGERIEPGTDRSSQFAVIRSKLAQLKTN